MRVVITGGTGFIGRALTRSLVRDGHEVVVLTRRVTVGREPSGVQLATWDGRTGQSFARQVEGADALVNLAGENIASGLWTARRRRRIMESRLQAGQACLEALSAIKRRPSCLVQASAVGYYGDRGDEPVSEDSSAGSGFLADVARRWEASTAPVAALGVRRVVVRTAVVLARDGGALPRMMLPFRFFLGGPLGSGRQWFPWVHLADEVGAIRHLLESPEVEGTFNLVAPEAVTQAQWARALGQAMERPARLPVPAVVLRLLLGEMAKELFLGGAKVRPDRLLASGYAFRFPSLTEALCELFGDEAACRD